MGNILIVGAGPTGLTLACLLQHQGVPFTIIDSLSKRSSATKAIGISHSTLSVFSELGIKDKVLEKSLQVKKTILYWNNKKIANIQFRDKNVEYSNFIYSTQPEIEHELEQYLMDRNIFIERGNKVTFLETKKDKVLVRMVSEKTEKESEFEYVVACDGSHSTIKNIINVGSDFENYGAYFTLCDVKMHWNNWDGNTHYFINKDGYLMLIPLPNNSFRIIFSNLGEFDKSIDQDIQPSQLEQIISSRSGQTVGINQIDWQTKSYFLHNISKRAGLNNVFLAGDAFHVFSPVGGTNMNAGIQDAVSLANKLINFYKNHSNDSILDEYESERFAFIKKNLKLTKKATFAMINPSKANERYLKLFLPHFNNRRFISSLLPMQFSNQY